MRRLSVAEDVILGDLGSWDVAQVSSCDGGGGDDADDDDDADDHADEPLLDIWIGSRFVDLLGGLSHL